MLTALKIFYSQNGSSLVALGFYPIANSTFEVALKIMRFRLVQYYIIVAGKFALSDWPESSGISVFYLKCPQVAFSKFNFII